MIKETAIPGALNGQEEKYLVKRTFLPVEVEIDRKGAFKTFRVKLSPKVKRVAGIVATADITIVAPTWYAGPGVGPGPLTGEFITGLAHSGGFENGYVEVTFEVAGKEWGYYAQPQRMDHYEVSAIGKTVGIALFDTIMVTDPGTGFTEPYQVWRTLDTGPFIITIAAKNTNGI